MCLAVVGVLAAWPIGSGASRSAARPAQAAAAVTPFRVAVPDAVLTDLRERLTRTRFPDEIEGSGWTYGTNLAYLEIVRWPRRWVEAQYNLVRWTEIPRGGHFAAFEEPLLLVEGVRAFFRDLLDR